VGPREGNPQIFGATRAAFPEYPGKMREEIEMPEDAVSRGVFKMGRGRPQEEAPRVGWKVVPKERGHKTSAKEWVRAQEPWKVFRDQCRKLTKALQTFFPGGPWVPITGLLVPVRPFPGK